METTDKQKLQKELNRIQKELKAPKTQLNKFAEFKYRSAEDIINAYKKVAGDTILVLNDEIIFYSEAIIYVKSTATLTLNNEEISTTAFARDDLVRVKMTASQVTGSASSYARKYAMNGLFAIDDVKDADTNEFIKQVNPTPVNPTPVKKIKKQQLNIFNYGTEDLTSRWKNAIKGIENGTIKFIKDIEKYYEFNNEVKENLEKILKEKQAKTTQQLVSKAFEIKNKKQNG